MRNILLLFYFTFFISSVSFSQAEIVLNEIYPNSNQIELKNIGNSSTNVGSYWFCNFPSYTQVQNATIVSGSLDMAPGDILLVETSVSFNATDAEMGLYTSSNFGSSNAMIDYVEWGSTGHTRSSVAVAAGIWTTGDFHPVFANTESLAYDGEGDSSTDWTAGTPTPGQENFDVCDAVGGILTGGPFIFDMVGDGNPDMIPAGAITLANDQGQNSQWVVTDDAGYILGLPPMPSVVDFDGPGPGTCLVWHLSYDDGLVGLEVGLSANDLEGCHSLSNPVEVIRSVAGDCQANGGELFGGPFIFDMVGDGNPDMIPAGAITLANDQGQNSQWVVTDDAGYILGLPPMPSAVNFDGPGPGTCLIWHLSYDDGLVGLEVGLSANDLEGCHSLSNPVEVIRSVAGDCQANGGELFGGPFIFDMVGDGNPDMIPAGAITLANDQGQNSQWVVTDDAGYILGLPPMPSAVNFDGPGPGTCLIWHLSYDDGLVGLEVGLSANDLEGCHSLSNPVEVIRSVAGDCQANGGELFGGPFIFDMVGDGNPDMIPAGAITLANDQGQNSQWVVTDDAGYILGLPPMPSVVDFDGPGPGTCLIWHLSYDDGLVGLEVGLSANDLEGCHSLSNPVEVIRSVAGDCQANGGELFGGPFIFDMVGDGNPDMIPAGAITLANDQGQNSQWVVTDDAGYILGLPPMPSVVDFDGPGPGTCLIWHLSYDDGLVGLEVGLSANDLEGCHSLSNPVEVIRSVAGDCQANGGELFGGPFIFDMVGDGNPDMIPAGAITLANDQGQNSQWVVTDDAGYILGLPPMPSVVDFDGPGPGTCLIWHLSYDDGLVGLEVGLSANDLEGCHSLSNPVEVIRSVAGDCQVNGGELFGGPFVFCVGDSVADNIPAGAITLANDQGQNSQWVVTDDLGNILGLPPTFEAVDFDDAPAGTCYVWHLSFEDGLMGAEMGNNAMTDLVGCFDLSNPVEVIRNNPIGGVLTGGPFDFCVGNGEADNIPAGGITLSGNEGTNSQWVVTDDSGNILGLPPTFEAVDFDDAPAGTCYVWHLSFEDGLMGAEVGNNAMTDLVGCYDLSNPIEVNRNQQSGGVLTGGPFTFCVGDSIADNIEAGAITLSDNVGTNSQWVVTDDMGNILGLPPSFEAVDFDDAPIGNCYVWHLSFEDGLTGAEVGNNAMTDLVGCFGLSNPIEIIRLDAASSQCITGIGELENISNKIEIYPNPVNENMNIELESLDGFDLNSIQISDLTGKIVELENFKTIGNRLVFDFSNLRAGVYILTLQNNESRIAKRIIKN